MSNSAHIHHFHAELSWGVAGVASDDSEVMKLLEREAGKETVYNINPPARAMANNYSKFRECGE
jgi:hypothetical protein